MAPIERGSLTIDKMIANAPIAEDRLTRGHCDAIGHSNACRRSEELFCLNF